MAVLLIICTVVLIVCAVKWIYRNKELYSFAEQIKGPKAYAVIGSSHKFLKKREEDRFQIVKSMLEKYQQHKLVRLWLGPALFVFINDPTLIEQVLASPKCLEKSFFYKFLRLDKGLLAAKHESWAKHRKYLECSFKSSIISSFIPTFVDSADQMLQALKQHDQSKEIDIFAITSRCALTMVLATSFGLNAQEVSFSDEILKAVQELIKIISKRCHEPILYIEPIYRITRSYYREKKYRKRCYNYLDQVLKERRESMMPIDDNSNHQHHSNLERDEEMGQPGTEHKNFIDQLIFNDGDFSDEEIHDHIYTLIAAGYDTTALQTAFTILLLAMHPETQEKVFDEIFEFFPSEDIKTTKESIDKLKFFDLVIKESMRLLPPVPLIGRETFEAFELDGLVFPPGVTLLVNLFNLHRRKDIWGPDSEDFNPLRFSAGQHCERHSHSFIPFSMGARDCIGKNYAIYAIKVTLLRFFKSYKVTTDLKYEELKFKADITLKIVQNLMVKIVKR